MWEKKIYPLDKSKKKYKGMIRKQRHHAVASNQLLVPDKRGTSSQKAHWSRLHYGSASWMLNQLTNEFDDVLEDYENDHGTDDSDDHDRDDSDGGSDDIGDGGGSDDSGDGGGSDDMTGGVETKEEEEAEMMGYVYVEFEREVESEDEWVLIGNM
ncbi:uncharacterized protein LOC144562075 isoform X3 [Carex rostrata]